MGLKTSAVSPCIPRSAFSADLNVATTSPAISAVRLLVLLPDPLQQCRAVTSGAAQNELSCIDAGGGYINLKSVVRKALDDSFGPFDQAQPVAAVREFVGPDCDEFVRVTEAIRIKMRDRDPSVHVQLQQHKRWAVDLRDIDSQRLTDCPHEPCLTGSQLTVQLNNHAFDNRFRDARTQSVGGCFISTINAERITEICGHTRCRASASVPENLPRKSRHRSCRPSLHSANDSSSAIVDVAAFRASSCCNPASR